MATTPSARGEERTAFSVAMEMIPLSSSPTASQDFIDCGDGSDTVVGNFDASDSFVRCETFA
ncbi:MAG: hypothetical protein WKF83_12830 [Nocardioidaceae bacterium]